MIPINQEFVHDPANGQHGDCQRAVIASILELPITEVPHFAQLAKDDTEKFWELVYDFLDEKNMSLNFINREQALDYDGFMEIAGPSPRGNGVFHAVVGHSGKVVFDPHPSRSGLVGDPDAWYYGVYEAKISSPQ